MKKKKGFSNDSAVSHQLTEGEQSTSSGIGEYTAGRTIVSQELVEQFERFYEYHPARRFSRNLRSMLLEFLMYDGSVEAEYLRELMIDLDGLFTLLDAMEEESERSLSPKAG